MAHKTYLETKEEQAKAQKAEEAEYRQQMMEKFAADDRIEQMNAQKRRMKQLGKKKKYVNSLLHMKRGSSGLDVIGEKFRTVIKDTLSYRENEEF